MSGVIATWDNAEPGDTIGKPKAAQHTPGPWTLCRHWIHTDCPCGTHRGYIWAPDGERVVAQMGCGEDEGGMVYPSPGKAEARSNAHLIAAAPDLLDACESSLAWAEKSDGTKREVKEQLRAAIAKARGGAQ